jgi:hypothetical protein
MYMYIIHSHVNTQAFCPFGTGGDVSMFMESTRFELGGYRAITGLWQRVGVLQTHAPSVVAAAGAELKRDACYIALCPHYDNPQRFCALQTIVPPDRQAGART